MRLANISAEEKLETLRRLDPLRTWQSLDDVRVCIFCDHPITGQQVTVRQDRNGFLYLACPTRGCSGTPEEWVYPGSFLTGASAARSRNGRPPAPPARRRKAAPSLDGKHGQARDSKHLVD